MNRISKRLSALLLSLSFLVCTLACRAPHEGDEKAKESSSVSAPAAATSAEARVSAEAVDSAAAETSTSSIPSASSKKAGQEQDDAVSSKTGIPSSLSELKSEAKQGSYKDGRYEASAVGYAGGLKVAVTVKNGSIAAVDVLSHNEVGEQYYKPAIKEVPPLIVEKQSVEGIDTVAGSTMTTKGIVNAVKKALKKASIS